MIKDSGNRTKFETGAMRDMKEGKGRCDLMPLLEVASLYNDPDIKIIFGCLNEMSKTEDYETGILNAVIAIKTFITYREGRCDVIDISELMLSVARHYEEGAKKYGERNWEKGIPLSSYINSACRHFFKYLAGWDDERHDRAFVWNILGYMYEFRRQVEKGGE